MKRNRGQLVPVHCQPIQTTLARGRSYPGILRRLVPKVFREIKALVAGLLPLLLILESRPVQGMLQKQSLGVRQPCGARAHPTIDNRTYLVLSSTTTATILLIVLFALPFTLLPTFELLLLFLIGRALGLRLAVAVLGSWLQNWRLSRSPPNKLFWLQDEEGVREAPVVVDDVDGEQVQAVGDLLLLLLLLELLIWLLMLLLLLLSLSILGILYLLLLLFLLLLALPFLLLLLLAEVLLAGLS